MPGTVEPADAGPRRILFLQGPLSPLYRMIGDQCRAAGHKVFRINFCVGDWLHWHGGGCSSFKGAVAQWPDFVGRFLDDHAITDIVLHGDQRIYHRLAVKEAQRRGIRIAATELGYLRPGWMTLERGGLSTLSHFPILPEQIRGIAAKAGPIDLAPNYPASLYLQTIPDVIYNLSNVVAWPLYPNYQRHTLYPPVAEYLRGAVRLAGEKGRTKRAGRKFAELAKAGHPYFILPLQLEGDFQLRRHSPFKSFAEVIELVMKSFSTAAPSEARLVIKTHPLDVGFENWPVVIDRLGRTLGIADRLVFLDGGGLGALFDHASGMVTLNSTAGLEALLADCPVKCLVPAHYDISGLTHDGSLESFWQDPVHPDADLLRAYVTAIAATIQVRGSIHNRAGVAIAAGNIACRILENRLNEPGGYVDVPPRLARARALGVPL